MIISKEERNQWREKLLSHLTCFDVELARIRTAAVGDMLGDSKALDEMGPETTIFRLCRELELARKCTLPRALEWTDEPPKVPGWYWYLNSNNATVKMMHIASRPFGIAAGTQLSLIHI